MRLTQLILKPVISEKSMDKTAGGKYTFQVAKNANKPEIKKAIRDLYNVEVEDVKIIKVSGKIRRRGRFMGKEANFKKAIITVKKGQKIEGFEIKEPPKEKIEGKDEEKK